MTLPSSLFARLYMPGLEFVFTTDFGFTTTILTKKKVRINKHSKSVQHEVGLGYMRGYVIGLFDIEIVTRVIQKLLVQANGIS